MFKIGFLVMSVFVTVSKACVGSCRFTNSLCINTHFTFCSIAVRVLFFGVVDELASAMLLFGQIVAGEQTHTVQCSSCISEVLGKHREYAAGAVYFLACTHGPQRRALLPLALSAKPLNQHF